MNLKIVPVALVLIIAYFKEFSCEMVYHEQRIMESETEKRGDIKSVKQGKQEKAASLNAKNSNILASKKPFKPSRASSRKDAAKTKPQGQLHKKETCVPLSQVAALKVGCLPQAQQGQAGGLPQPQAQQQGQLQQGGQAPQGGQMQQQQIQQAQQQKLQQAQQQRIQQAQQQQIQQAQQAQQEHIQAQHEQIQQAQQQQIQAQQQHIQAQQQQIQAHQQQLKQAKQQAQQQQIKQAQQQQMQQAQQQVAKPQVVPIQCPPPYQMGVKPAGQVAGALANPGLGGGVQAGAGAPCASQGAGAAGQEIPFGGKDYEYGFGMDIPAGGADCSQPAFASCRKKCTMTCPKRCCSPQRKNPN